MSAAGGDVLQGVRVLELGNFITGPYAGMLLADLGADVIKVERPEGDPFRAFRDGQYSPNFVAFNRNKRSVRLDLGSAAGRDALLRLIDTADVLIENFRPGVMEKMGLGWETLHARRPSLVYCAIGGFLPGSRYEGQPAFDTIGQALSGMLDTFLDPDRPQVRGPTISDQLAGMYACYGILGALYARQAGGPGRRVDVNMIEASMSFMPDFFASHTREGTRMNSTTRASYSHSFAFECADGARIGLQLSSPGKFWEGLLRALEMPELRDDPRFASRSARIANFDALSEILRERFRTRPRGHWLDALRAADVPHAPVLTVPEIVDDPEFRAAGSFHDLHHPAMGAVRALSRPVRYDGERPPSRYAPPMLGEHTAEILAECGLPPAQIAALENGRPG
ncbi:Formyl-coenzyme A transferase [Pigmentiphaga humi]|uniref:Formyl-coenzyme A transferase n=1 Tax=Pigmentiphaga humi TaxID=2478468 RepID=A0A3P4B5Z0_9BURK|nr:CoA transferase [Pigmentiphaga humi]VCU70585.1 Formyl-coenzyme A transferase [Pigmentiphaga humi]